MGVFFIQRTPPRKQHSLRTNDEAIKELVKLGLGISIVARWIAREEIEERSLVALPLGRRKLKRQWGVLHWKGKRLNLAEETIVGLCEEACVSLQIAEQGCPA